MVQDNNSLISSLKSFRYLTERLADGCEVVLRDAQMNCYTSEMIYPCDIIDLRQILFNTHINSQNDIVLFSFNFAKKYLTRYPIFIVLKNKLIIDKSMNFGSVQVYKTNKLDIDKSVSKLIINQPLDINSIKTIINIIKDTGCKLDYYMSNSVPGTSGFNPKLSKKVNMKKAQANKVNLSPKEQQIFDFLVQVKKYFNINTEFRVAGGWVRDKMMGRASDDIDIALSNMTGSQLVDYLRKYPNGKGIIGKDFSVAENVDKSKHLETAGISLFGQKVEFVNLRSETYTNTRIPEMKMGTPETDAKRRDLTINALFYNIETGNVEDYVGGIEDLNNKILRTPLDPVQTFEDDPLRMLRALRFYSRFNGFKLDQSIIDAMKMPDVQDAYAKKVSTERAGPEIMKLLIGENPSSALRILFETGLYTSVFKVPEMADLNPDGIKMDQRNPYHDETLLEHTLLAVEGMNNAMKERKEDDRMRGVMNLSALFHDFGKMKANAQTPHPKVPNSMQYLTHSEDSTAMAESILKSIGVGRDEREIATKVISLHMEPHDASKWTNKGMGSFLRKSVIPGQDDISKKLWDYIFLHAKIDQQARNNPKENNEWQSSYDKFNEYVNSPRGQMNHQKGTEKKILDGNEIKSLIPELEQKTGFIKDVTNRLTNLIDEGQIDVSFIAMPEGPEKEQSKQNAKQVAIQKVMEMKPDILNQYQKKARNWYGMVKSSQVATPYPIKNEMDGIKKGPAEAVFPFSVGMKVRDRRKGAALPQEYGIIRTVNDGKMIVEWHNKDGSKSNKTYSLDDTVAIHEIITEV